MQGKIGKINKLYSNETNKLSFAAAAACRYKVKEEASLCLYKIEEFYQHNLMMFFLNGFG